MPKAEDIQKIQNLVTKLAKENGIGAGDVIAKMTKFFGIEPCSRCVRTQAILNKLRIKNWQITWENIKDY